MKLPVSNRVMHKITGTLVATKYRNNVRFNLKNDSTKHNAHYIVKDLFIFKNCPRMYIEHYDSITSIVTVGCNSHPSYFRMLCSIIIDKAKSTYCNNPSRV